jgi:hypothetical protein
VCEVTPTRHRTFKLNLKYKERVKAELYRMIEDGIIKLVAKFEWISPMVVQDKKKRVVRICVDLRNLNDAYFHDPFSSPFTYVVLENIGGKEAYSFTNGFSGYHQIKIAPEDIHNMAFAIE